MLRKSRVLVIAAGLAATSALLIASTSPETIEVTETNEVIDTAALKDDVMAVLAGPKWLHVGCIELGNDCYDVFEDNKGDLWVCDECFTTQNPNKGKCRRLTPQEIANAAWCA